MRSLEGIEIHQHDYLFTAGVIKELEAHLNAKFLLDIDPRIGAIGSLFYSENPDVSKGHVHYVFFRHNGRQGFVSAFQPTQIAGILEDGVFYYSAYDHDFVRTPRGSWIDGGMWYTRSGGMKDAAIMHLEPTGPRIERIGNVAIEQKPEGGLPSVETASEEAYSDV